MKSRERLKTIYLKACDALFGNEKEIERRLARLLGKDAGEGQATGVRKKNAKYFATVFLLLLFAGAVGILLPQDSGTEKLALESGEVLVIPRPESGQEMYTLRLSARKGAEEAEKEVSLSVLGVKSAEPEEFAERETVATLDERMDEIAALLSKDREGESLVLPARLEDGTELHWELPKKASPFPLIPALFLPCFLAYKRRYESLEKEERAARASIKRELPGFMNSLYLLLNAGLVLTEAFERVALSYEREDSRNSYFREQICQIYGRVAVNKSRLAEEFRDFAFRSGVRELGRFANILADNIDKGAGLTEKLRSESEALRLERKKAADEEGRLAETKMTFPLALMLLSLVAVTVAPAMLTM